MQTKLECLLEWPSFVKIYMSFKRQRHNSHRFRPSLVKMYMSFKRQRHNSHRFRPSDTQVKYLSAPLSTTFYVGAERFFRPIMLFSALFSGGREPPGCPITVVERSAVVLNLFVTANHLIGFVLTTKPSKKIKVGHLLLFHQ
jgi:hypothetical protein